MNNTVYPYGTSGSLPSSIGLVNDFVTGGVDKALTAEAGKTLYNTVLGEREVTTYTKADAATYLVNSNGAEVSDSPYRIRVVFSALVGDVVTASCSLGKGVACSIYDSLAKAKKASLTYLQTISYSYVSSLSGTVKYNGYLSVSLAKSDDSTFTSSEVESYLAALNLSISRVTSESGVIPQINHEIRELQNSVSGISRELKEHEIFIGTLVQKSLTSSGLSDDNKDYRVSMASCTVVPRENAKLTFHLPTGVAVGIRSGNKAGSLSTNSYWFYNGETFTFSSSAKYFRICFSKPTQGNSYEVISVDEIQNHISLGEISITVAYEDGIVLRNYENEKYVKAAMRNFVSGADNNGSLTKLPIFAHTSDVHGDAERFNSFADYCDYLGVDAALVSGDTVASTPSDSMQYINDIADTHSTMILPCMGNHDANGLTTAQDQNEKILGYLITKNSVTTNVSEDYPTYYYKDFESKKIRVISLNLYELTHSGHNCLFTQTQCEWLISVLSATPQDYGVLIMFHSPEEMPAKDDNYGSFYQSIVNYSGLQSGLTGSLFTKLIDAFIGKSSISITYKSAGTNITVSADFTNVASGVEFIAFVNGHLHVDRIGYIQGANYRQLNLNVCCGIAVYGTSYAYLANNSDMPRSCLGSTQDCFNIYAIDRAAKTVRIAKVGSNVSSDLADRKYMVIPYAD